MSAVGIICEYNPFHKGHKHQIEQAKELSGCDAAVCVMSGPFVQRGDAAVFDKWTRAEAALKNGADLVLELPSWYVLQSAEVFAFGGVEILKNCGVIDAISFGSESADKKGLFACAEIIANENPLMGERIEAIMSEGAGYPLALRRAVEEIYPHLSPYLSNPNDMLGASYISAMLKHGADFDVFPVKRHIAQHNSGEIKNDFASSTAIRNAMENGEDISTLLPYGKTGAVHNIKNIESLILGFYRTASPDSIADVPGSESGFENKLISCAKKACSLDEFYESAVSRRYTLSRVHRVALAGVLGIKKGMNMDYIRVLGMTGKGAALIKEAKEKSSLPFVVKTADFSPAKNSTFVCDMRATDIAALCCEDKNLRKAGRDFYTSPVVID